MPAEIVNEIKEFINREILDHQGSDLTETTPLLALGILDSFTLVSLLSFLADRYGIQFEIADINPEDMETIAKIADLVDRTRSQA